jgi:ubiquinone/menaquinone biosynthesis C-methylase UbiE
MSEAFTSKFERKEEPREHLIVEVGSGVMGEESEPAFWKKVSPEYWEWFENNLNARYIGVDVSGENLARATRETPAHDRISFLHARAEALPFADGSVHELIMKNVLGDPDIAVETKHAALKEAARVLTHGGTMRVIETFTPIMVHEDNLYQFIEDMEGSPFSRFTDDEEQALPYHEKSADRALATDEAAADTMKLGQSYCTKKVIWLVSIPATVWAIACSVAEPGFVGTYVIA